jgi:thiopeptide-type bacteriocin biosynthesis protein
MLLEHELRQAAGATSGGKVDFEPDSFYQGFESTDVPWMRDGDVVRAQYHPELARYGGELAMQVCEDFFWHSSRLALDVLATVGPGGHSEMIMADLMALGLDVMRLTDRNAVVSARSYFASWDFSPEVHTDALESLERARQAFYPSAVQRQHRVDLLREKIVSGDGTIHGAWLEAMDAVVGELSVLKGRGDLLGEMQPIFWSLMHMMCNRLGIPVATERALVWLTSLVYPRRRVPDAFFDEDLGAPDFVYLESSKFRQPEMGASQAPRSQAGSDGPSAHLWHAEATRIPLSVDRAPSMRLSTALSQRRSGYSGYDRALSVKTLGGILRLACGTSRSGGAIGEVRRRTYPSGGALYCVQALVLVSAVSGLSEGVYRYAPETHDLVEVDADPPRASWAGFGSFFAAHEITEDVRGREIAAVVALAVDLRSIRAKYGLRAFRLAMLEVGHIAQSIGLSAAAFAVPSVHLQEFDDDAVNARLHLNGLDRFVAAMIPLGGPSGLAGSSRISPGAGKSEARRHPGTGTRATTVRRMSND